MSRVRQSNPIGCWARRSALLAAVGIVLVAGLSVAWGQEPAQPAAKAEAKADVVVVVEAEGEGLDKEQATKVALRAALEKGGKQELFSDSKVENYQLIHDTIISRAMGIVTDYKVLEEKKIVGGTFKVKIKALVSKRIMKENWGAIQNVLNQIGRPKIMVDILERIDGRPEEQSLLETKIEERLLKSGFDLVARQAIDAAKHKEMDDAAANGNTAKLQALAKSFAAHIFITGTANANQAGMEDLYGAPTAFYNCDAQIKAYYTDSAKLLASKGLPNTRGGARGRKEFSPQAGKQALEWAGLAIVEEIYGQVMEQWTTQISAGGEIVLEVEGLKFKDANDLQELIKKIEGVNSVAKDFSKALTTYRISAKMSADDLAGRMTKDEFARKIEVEDVKLNRIQAKATTRSE